MQWLTDFQASFREPVFRFLSVAWPVLALGAVGAVWYVLFDGWKRSTSGGDGGDGGFLPDGDGDGGGDGGGGGGD